MNKINIYWPVFKNLEKEVLALADTIHFCDEQLNVYSVKIAELLFRCAVEIESISKELYEQNGGNVCPVDSKEQSRDLYFDTDCLNYLEQKWVLSKKQVLVSAPTMYFEKDENKILTPLKKANKRGESGSDWKQAYQAVKHERGKSLNRANIKHLIRAMAALYVLNVYYRNESFSTDSLFTVNVDFDASLSSNIFSITLSDRVHINQVNEENSTGTDTGIVDYIYLLCFPQHTATKIQALKKESFQKQKDAFLASKEFIDFYRSGGSISKEQDLFGAVLKVGTWAYKQRIMSLPTKDEQLSAIYNSSEYKRYSEKNTMDLENITKDDVDALCARVGYCGYFHRIIGQNGNALPRECFMTKLNIILNKGQHIYADGSITSL